MLKLARLRPLHDQEQIAHLMQQRGFEVTQASVSRDVRELGLVKLDGRYLPADELAAVQAASSDASADALQARLAELITAAEPVGANLLVVRTPIGAASAVGAALDEEHLPEIAGTIAGDDTLFVAVRSRASQGRLLARLKAIVRP